MNDHAARLQQQPYVFVSYARADRERVGQVVAELEAAGVHCWVDQHAIEAGTNWGQEITDAIDGCAAFVLMSSAASLASRNVRQEVAIAWKFNRPYLPCLLDATPFPRELTYWLETAQWVEVLDHPADVWLPRITRALDRLGVGADQPSPVSLPVVSDRHVPPPPVELVGRDRELAAMRGLLTSASEGQGQLALLGGDAGMGKTTLATQLLHEAASGGALVLAGGCYDLSTTPPYGPWVEGLRGYAPSGGLPPYPASLRAEGIGQLNSQAALFDEVWTFLRSVASHQPLVVVLEDLHWADQASLDLLRVIGRQVSGATLLLLGTYRTDELHRRHPLYQLLPTLEREARATRIELGPLDSAAIAALIDRRYQLLPADRDRLAAHVQRHGEGHALYVSELLRTLEDEGALSHDEDGVWALRDLGRIRVPRLVREVIESRVARLPDEAQSALSIAAVIGQDVSVDLWLQVSDESEHRLVETIDQAVAAHLLTMSADGTSVHFRHALIRESLYESILPLRRRGWHRRAAELLAEERDPDPDAVAYHFQQASDPRAFPWLVRAGDRAQGTYAIPIAIERFEAAVQLAEQDPARTREHAWLLYRIGRLLRMFDPRQGMRYLHAARELSQQADDRILSAFTLFDIGNMHAWRGEVGQAVDAMRAGIVELAMITPEDLERDPPVVLWTADSYSSGNVDRLLDLTGVESAADLRAGTLAFVMALSGRIAEAEHIATPFIERLSLGKHSDVLLSSYSDACHALALVAGHCSQVGDARRWFQEALLARESLGFYHQAANNRSGELESVILPYESFDLETRDIVADQIDSGLRRSGTEDRRGIVLSPKLALEGRWQEMNEVLDDLRADPSHQRSSVFRANGFVVLVALGEYDVLDRAVRHFFPDGPATAPGNYTYFTLAPLQALIIESALLRGDMDVARAWLDTLDFWIAWAGDLGTRSRAATLRACYEQAIGNHRAARDRIEDALHFASDPPQPLAELAALRVLGALDTADGLYQDAERRLVRSLDLAVACRAPFEQAQTHIALAELRLAQDDPVRAASTLAEARAICEPLGARPTLERIAALEQHVGASVHEGGRS